MAIRKGSKRINEATAKDTPSPSSGRTVIRDDKLAGFQLVVTAGGERSFYFRFRDQKKLLGHYPALKAGAARDLATIAAGQLAAGSDPFVATRRTSPSVSTFFEEFHEKHSKENRKGILAQDKHLFETYMEPHIGKVKLIELTTRQVRDMHLAIRDKAAQSPHARGESPGARTANQALQLLSSMIYRAKEWGLLKGESPVTGVKRFAKVKRERYLKTEEAPAFFAALGAKETAPEIRDLVALALFTGARKGNVMSMRWDEVDFAAATWTIPARKAKTKSDYHIPLVPIAIEILSSRLRESAPELPWVFPADSVSGHISSIERRWREVRERAGLNDLRFHDLRHTLGSWMAAGSAGLPIVGAALGHKDQATTQRYVHLADGPVRAAMHTTVTALVQAGGFAQIEGGEE